VGQVDDLESSGFHGLRQGQLRGAVSEFSLVRYETVRYVCMLWLFCLDLLHAYSYSYLYASGVTDGNKLGPGSAPPNVRFGQ
jgi:hypothetical protein